MTPLKSDRLTGSSVPPRRDDIRAWGRTRLSCFSRIFCGSARAAMGLLLLAAIALGAQPELARAQTTATYTVTFKGNWNIASTPGGVVGGAHFTTLIGAVHDSDVTFWAPGGTATSGVEGVAELGSTGTFKSEINAAAAGTVKSTVEASGVGATGQRTFEVEFSRTHPLLTLLSMIGPSPDWFVGVSGLSLLDSSDAWLSSRMVNLFPYDAGTEDGEEFSLSNAATVPQGTITSIKGQGKFTNTRMARLSFTLQSNRAPEFSSTNTTRSFAETVGDATVGSAGDIGTAVTATDDDNDTLAYSLEGTDKDSFTIDSGTGQIKTKVGSKYDRETKASYSVTVKADDSNGGTDTIAVTINVTNMAEKPLMPARPSVSSGSTMSVNVMWNAPSNTGRPAITSYDLRYKKSSDTGWSDGPQGVTATNTSIGGLEENTEYQVQVLATNSDGDGPWSQPGTGRTNVQGNRMPEFMEGITATRSFMETVGDARVGSAGNVGAVVTATDADDDMLTYTLEGADKDEFTIDSSGQIRTKVGKSYDRETKARYSVMVMANDQNAGTDTIVVTVNVTDAEEKPLASAAPSVSAASATSVNVMWNAPSNGGRPAINTYDLQYRQGMTGGWTDGPQGVTGTSSTIMNLMENTEYQVQVRANNSDGDGTWSEPGTGRTNRVPVPPPPPTEEEVEGVCAVSSVTDDQSLEGFVECAAESIEISDTFEETLRLLDEFRDDKGTWNDGSTYLVLLTGRGGVYFHANDREVEDMDWSGILSCEGEGSVLDTQEGCLIEYDGASSGYAHPFSASHVPLAHGENEFVLLGGFDETSEGKPLTGGGVIGGPSTEAGDVDTDDELREFVEDAGRVLGEAVENPEIDPAKLRGILRREGPWREGDVYIYIMDETGRVIFDGADRNREQRDEYEKQHVKDLIAEAGEGIVEYTEGGLLRRGYAVRVEVSLDEEEASRVYVVGSGYHVEEQSDMEESGKSGNGGGGCAVGGSDSGGALGLFLAALALFLTVSLKRHSAEDKMR